MSGDCIGGRDESLRTEMPAATPRPERPRGIDTRVRHLLSYRSFDIPTAIGLSCWRWAEPTLIRRPAGRRAACSSQKSRLLETHGFAGLLTAVVVVDATDLPVAQREHHRVLALKRQAASLA